VAWAFTSKVRCQSSRASGPTRAPAWNTWVIGLDPSPGNDAGSKSATSPGTGATPAWRKRASSPGLRHRAKPYTSWSRASARATGNPIWTWSSPDAELYYTPAYDPDLNVLYGIAIANGHAWAVGTTDNEYILIEHWDGTTWTIASPG